MKANQTNDPKRRLILQWGLTSGLGAMTLTACGGGGASEAVPDQSKVPVAPSPAPSPAPTPPALLTFKLVNTTGSAGNKYFSAGQTFCLGDVPAGQELGSDASDFQASELNRWHDGSLKFALISGRAELNLGESKTFSIFKKTRGVPLAAQPAITEAELRGTGAKIAFLPYGSVALDDLIGLSSQYSSSDGRWSPGRVKEIASGPFMSSWLYFSPLDKHRHLSAWFEVRCHKGRHIEILPWVENGWLNVPHPNSFTGELEFSIEAASQLKMSLELPNHTRTPLLKGNPQPYQISTAGFAEVICDCSYLQKTRLVPSYFPGVTDACLNRQAKSFEPFARLSFSSVMGIAGYAPSIGLLPEWDACYLASGGDMRAKVAVLAHGLAGGRFSIHYRDETTNQPVLFKSYPSLGLGIGPATGVTNVATSNPSTPVPLGAVAPVWASSHHPSIGFLAYLLTGWNYFSEQMQFAATLHFLKQQSTARMQSDGILRTNAGTNTTRGAAWSLRTLVQACVAIPDRDADLRAEFLRSIAANISFYHDTCITKKNNPQGFCVPYSDYTQKDGKYMHATWMEDFLTGTFGYMKAIRLELDAVTLGKLDEFYTWKVKSVIGRLGPAGDPGSFHYCDAPPYTIAVAPSDTADFVNSQGPWYANWGQIYEATLGRPNTAAAEDKLRGAYFPDPTSYWGNMQPAIVYAVEHGVSGAKEAYARMTSASNWMEFVTAARGAPVWALRPLA